MKETIHKLSMINRKGDGYMTTLIKNATTSIQQKKPLRMQVFFFPRKELSEKE